MVVRFCALISLFGCSVLGFFTLDYLQLRTLRASYRGVSNENEGLKGEARVLMQNLEEVKHSDGGIEIGRKRQDRHKENRADRHRD